MSKITVVINTLNEEDNIVDAIDSAKKIADEVVVVDMKSDDNTKDLAKTAGARVFEHKRMGYVEPARNFAISKATHDWVFILDADERINKNLAKKLLKISEEDEFMHVAIPRKNIIFGKWIKNSRWWPDYNIRFFKKDYVEWGDEIHSVPLTSGKGTDLKPNSKNAIIHNHYTSVSQYLQRLDRYTSIQAKEYDGRFKWRDFIKRPTAEFLSRYFSAKGYRDGLHGLALAGLQAFSEFVLVLKIWELNKFKDKKIDSVEVVKEIRASQKELNYWLADRVFVKTGNWLERLRRKFRI